MVQDRRPQKNLDRNLKSRKDLIVSALFRSSAIDNNKQGTKPSHESINYITYMVKALSRMSCLRKYCLFSTQTQQSLFRPFEDVFLFFLFFILTVGRKTKLWQMINWSHSLMFGNRTIFSCLQYFGFLECWEYIKGFRCLETFYILSNDYLLSMFTDWY
jgi:hypothetical protein